MPLVTDVGMKVRDCKKVPINYKEVPIKGGKRTKSGITAVNSWEYKAVELRS